MTNNDTSEMDSNLIRSLSPSVGNFTVSLHYDKRLYKHDIRGSIAHAKMLAKQGIIESPESESICQGLGEIEEEITNGSFNWREDLEDIHMNIENRLLEKIGSVAGKLHTGRSRNDQVSTDMRMFVKDAVDITIKNLTSLQLELIGIAESHTRTVIPGYTHMQ